MLKQFISKNVIKSAIPLIAMITVGGFNVSAGELYYDMYGNVHLSVDSVDSKDNASLNSKTSSFGIKGGRKLGDSGVSVIFKMEWQVDVTVRNKNIVDRDQWVGLKGKFGKVIFGTATSNYKQQGGKVDPMYRTALEGRSGLMRIQSRRLHAGADIDRGRLTKSINYTTPKFNNFQVVMNTTISGSDNESSGIGIRHKTKKSLIYVDFFTDGDVNGSAESASKIGGYYKFGKLKISAQIENSQDIDGSDYWFIGATYKLSKSGTFKFSTGAADGKRDSSSIAVMYDHKLGGKTNVYVGYGSIDNNNGDDDSTFTVGLRYKF